MDPALPVPKSTYADVLDVARRRGIPWSAARAGQLFEVDGVTLRILHPSNAMTSSGDANTSSVVMLVSWRGFNALLTGDAYVDVEQSLIEVVGDIDMLKVGHHGSNTSTDSLFLAQTRPELALISVGRRNRYGHPSPDVVGRLRAAGAVIHRTDREGSVRVIVRRDGTFQVRSERGNRGANARRLDTLRAAVLHELTTVLTQCCKLGQDKRFY
jgi:competence protein ComEC